jgi:hypothetical protein
MAPPARRRGDWENARDNSSTHIITCRVKGVKVVQGDERLSGHNRPERVREAIAEPRILFAD